MYFPINGLNPPYLVKNRRDSSRDEIFALWNYRDGREGSSQTVQRGLNAEWRVSRIAFCSNCGKELPAGAAFCPGCGAVIGGATPPSQYRSGIDALAKDRRAQDLWLRRLIAYVIDVIAVGIVIGIVVLASTFSASSSTPSRGTRSSASSPQRSGCPASSVE